MASSNPTTGVGVAAYVQVTGTGITSTGVNGQGNGAGTGSTNKPVAQYALTLSLAGTATCQLTTVIKDVANTTISQVGTPVYKSYNNPAAGSPAWYHPSPATIASNAYNANVASVSSSGLITAIAKGQAIIEVQFPVFDNTLGTDTPTGNPKEMIFVQIIVTVTT